MIVRDYKKHTPQHAEGWKDGDAQQCLGEIFTYLYGKNAYVIDTGSALNANPIIVEHIKRDYKPRWYVRQAARRTALQEIKESVRRLFHG